MKRRYADARDSIPDYLTNMHAWNDDKVTSTILWGHAVDLWCEARGLDVHDVLSLPLRVATSAPPAAFVRAVRERKAASDMEVGA